ncbi:c2H2-type domain-containing protein [Trichonephila inaurata madagascariensis]|uniref:C2H2-type domain-containing protein n=1 Tax=Trichonephila inaurata madagascariensis TaxID=2747483 RepID=A0A8X6JM22_9ARAC|nr:c2H2-type domain-containing protein [Trichonephila inaurata madagascariensis]
MEALLLRFELNGDKNIESPTEYNTWNIIALQGRLSEIPVCVRINKSTLFCKSSICEGHHEIQGIRPLLLFNRLLIFEMIKETVDKFTLNELVKIGDVLSIDSEVTQLEIAKNIVTCPCDFEILKDSLTTEEILEETDELRGERHENVLHWIENFEAQSELLSLSEVHKFIYAKRCLRGNASLVVRSETGINSWKQLKDLLTEEFKISFNSAEAHEMLQKR